MDVVYQAVMMGCMVTLTACAIVFPILFLCQNRKFRKELIQSLMDDQSRND
ncbi:MAG: hypothetical protein PUF50_08870 [Erysipelotrichaceae bacterium]|nr:hypothetical protein [Erysipelotrichaceae bacterium]